MAQRPSNRVTDWVDQQRNDPYDPTHSYANDGEPVMSGAILPEDAPILPGSLSQDVLGHDVPRNDSSPEAIPLPSIPSSASLENHLTHEARNDYPPNVSDGVRSRSSLEVITQLGEHTSRRTSTRLGYLDSQPPSRHPEERRRPRRQVTYSRRQDQGKSSQDYDHILDRAAEAFDHIKNGKTRQPSRVEKTSITCFDYYEDHPSTVAEISASRNIPALRDVPPGLKQRVLFVEDLSKSTIKRLGACFGITPEFFEEHLLNSGYDGARYDDPPARTWKTASLAKSYVSIQWFRPVYHLPALFLHRDWVELLGDGIEYAVGTSKITTRTETNIFRSEWDLWTDPHTTARVRRECAWEERVSIWRRRLDNENTNCEIVVVLLDPLPAISETEHWIAKVPRQHNRTRSRGSRSSYYSYEYSNSSSAVTSRVGSNLYTPTPPVSTTPQIDFPEEGILYRLYEGDTIDEPQRVSADPSFWDRLLAVRRSSKPDEIRQLSRTSRRLLIESMAHRRPINIDLDRAIVEGELMDELQEELNGTRSTRQEVCKNLNGLASPLQLDGILFEIIRQDTLTLLQYLQQRLSEIETDIIDDTKMEDRLTLWRQIIGRAQQELPELKVSIRKLLAYSGSTADSDLELSFKELCQKIDEMLERLRNASSSLTSNMGLLDSRRSIDEAHAVARLTELAFIFIPLSFATSFFGMQVKTFEDPVPLYTFFVVAVVVTTFAYLMRLTMRSQWLNSMKVAVKQDVRQYAEQHGLPVQVRSVSVLLLLRWLLSRSWIALRLASTWTFTHGRKTGRQVWATMGFVLSATLGIGVVSAAPLAVLWSRKSLDPGVQGAVSLIILLVVIALVGIPFWRNSNSEFRNALPNSIRRLLRRVPSSTLRFVSWLVSAMALVVIPLALIWTQPLARGIKVALTVAILIIVTIGMATLLIFARASWSLSGRV